MSAPPLDSHVASPTSPEVPGPPVAAADGAPPVAGEASVAVGDEAADGHDHELHSAGERQTLAGRLSEWTADGEISAWLSSAIVHAALVLLLAVVALTQPGVGPRLALTASLDDAPVETPDLDFSASADAGADVALPPAEAPVLGDVNEPDTTFTAASETPLIIEPTASVGEIAIDPFPVMPTPLSMHGGGLDGRTPAMRRGLALSGGGSEESEAAVEAGLRWLAAHQYPDGGWRFDLEACPNCQGYCRNSGSNDSSTAATGLALLCFLGAGYTHQQGPFAEVVSDGLYYLEERMEITSFGGDLRDRRVQAIRAENTAEGILSALDRAAQFKTDNMYSHGIATLALTEAYAMTLDPGLRQSAEQAVKFTVNAQNADGGWRYDPHFEKPDASDTTVTGWQVMGLKSAVLGGISVPYEVWMKISQFLDENAINDGAEYAYRRGERTTKANSAIGLLCRELEGWQLDYRPLQRGLANLGKQRPQDNHIYYNYYATLALHHAGGSQWTKWNPKIREYLVESQSDEGHERGSWYFNEQYADSGGRLYTTSLSILTLEVYYRYLPLYKQGEGE